MKLMHEPALEASSNPMPIIGVFPANPERGVLYTKIYTGRLRSEVHNLSMFSNKKGDLSYSVHVPLNIHLSTLKRSQINHPLRKRSIYRKMSSPPPPPPPQKKG